MRLTGGILGITLWVTLAFLLLSTHCADAAPFFDKLFGGLGGQNNNNNNNNNGRNALEFSTQSSEQSGGGFMSDLKSTFEVVGSFIRSFLTSLKNNSNRSSSSTASSSSGSSKIEEDPDFDFSYFDNIDSNAAVSSAKRETADSGFDFFNTIDSDFGDIPDSANSVFTETQSSNVFAKVNSGGDTSVVADSIFKLNNEDSETQPPSLASINAESNSGSPQDSRRNTLRDTNVNVERIFDLDIGEPNTNNGRDSLVSVRTGPSATRVRAPFVSVDTSRGTSFSAKDQLNDRENIGVSLSDVSGSNSERAIDTSGTIINGFTNTRASVGNVDTAKETRLPSNTQQNKRKETQVNIPGIFDLDINGSNRNRPSGSLVSVRTGPSETRVRAPFVSVDTTRNSNSSPDTQDNRSERTQVNIPGIFNLDLGGSNVNGPTDSLVSVRRGASGIRIRAPFVDITV